MATAKARSAVAKRTPPKKPKTAKKTLGNRHKVLDGSDILDGFSVRGKPTPRSVLRFVVLKKCEKRIAELKEPLQGEIANHLETIRKLHPTKMLVYYGVALTKAGVVRVSSMKTPGSAEVPAHQVLDGGIKASYFKPTTYKIGNKAIKRKGFWTMRPYADPEKEANISLARKLGLAV